MSYNASAVRSFSGIRSSRLGVRVLKACLVFLMFFRLPAFADHVHHLWYNNSNWQDQDLTALTNGGIPGSFGAIAAFYTTPNRQLHVYYVDQNSGHMHQLYFNGTSWGDQDLTAFTGGPQAFAYGISGFAIGNFQYVFYVSNPDYHVHEMNYNNANWSDQDLTNTVGGNTASPAPLVAFATKPNNQFHVYYQDLSSLHVYQLYFNGSSWTYQDLTSTIGGAFCYGQWMAGFALGNEQHLFCPGIPSYKNEMDLLHIYYNNYNWGYQDVTDISLNGSHLPSYTGSAVAAFEAAGEKNVFSFTSDTHLNWYAFVDKQPGWYDFDLNSRGAPLDSQYGGMVAFATKPNNQMHVYYAPSSEVYQLYWNGSGWKAEDLTGGVGDADPSSGMAGFAIGNFQHVFYMSKN